MPRTSIQTQEKQGSADYEERKPGKNFRLALDQPIRDTAVADASTRFLARGGQWSPSAAVRRRIEQTALGREKCQRV
jgi:hypothetical protein